LGSTKTEGDSFQMINKKDFTSGAASSGNVPPYECLTRSFLRRSAKRMQLGMYYGKHNWKKGIHDKQFILDRLNHAFEHLQRAIHEIDNGIIMTDDDLAAVAVNCMFAMEYQESAPVSKIPSTFFVSENEAIKEAADQDCKSQPAAYPAEIEGAIMVIYQMLSHDGILKIQTYLNKRYPTTR
jgi:hypothetical protein